MIRSITRLGLSAAALMALATGASAGETAVNCDAPKPANFQELQTQFVKDYAKQDGVQVTATGIHYRVLKNGSADGAAPNATNGVEVHYSGTLVDGCKFDSSYDRGQTAIFPLNQVIAGWTEGLQLMKTGAKYEFVIPGDLAYGPRGTGRIPANATLIFQVELFDIFK